MSERRRKRERRSRRRTLGGQVIERVPWDYSEAPQPGEPISSRAERMPPEAVRIGAFAYRLARVGERRLLAQNLALPHPCRSCAFRLGTVPNRCIDTLVDAIKCVFEGDRLFRCHEPREGDSVLDQACWGFMRARAGALGAKVEP
jgi:hypothetical protein